MTLFIFPNIRYNKSLKIIVNGFNFILEEEAIYNGIKLEKKLE